MTQALVQANRDYARLRQIHQLEWQLDTTGFVRYLCSCDSKPRNAAANDLHIIKEVRVARGPVKSK